MTCLQALDKFYGSSKVDAKNVSDASTVGLEENSSSKENSFSYQVDKDMDESGRKV